MASLQSTSITGSLYSSGSVTIEHSGSVVFNVQGSQGQLFSITDDLEGSLFSVSDISGIPILEVSSDGTVEVDGTLSATTILGVVSSSAQIDYNSIQNQPTIPTNNNQLTNGAGYTTCTGTQTGTGTSGYISKWNGTTSQTNSSIYENGTTVGIGTTQSETSAKLLVGDSISAGSAAIAQFNGFIRVTDYVIIQNSSVLTDQVFLQYDTSDKGLVIVKSGTANGHIRPGTNGTQNLGSSTYRWNTVYTSDLSLKNDVGDWTIVEGEEDLFLYNNKKDKVYKFNLTEVDKDSAPKKRS
jgi:hypothetical protein